MDDRLRFVQEVVIPDYCVAAYLTSIRWWSAQPSSTKPGSQFGLHACSTSDTNISCVMPAD